MLSLIAPLLVAKSIAVVPIAGAGVTSSELVELAAVDDAVRAAVVRDGVTVQAKEQTSAALSSARSAGVLCALSDAPCWKKAAALCDVELLVVPSAALRGDGDVALVVTVVDVAKDPQRVAGVVPRKDAGARVKALVDDALARLDLPADPSIEDAPPTPIVDATSASAVASAATPGLPDAPVLVGAAAGVGAVVGVAVAALTSWMVITAPPKRAHQAP